VYIENLILFGLYIVYRYMYLSVLFMGILYIYYIYIIYDACPFYQDKIERCTYTVKSAKNVVGSWCII